MRRIILNAALLGLFSLFFLLPQPLQARNRVELGDDLQYMPWAALLFSIAYEGGVEGAAQMAMSWIATQQGTDNLKRFTQRKRPSWQPGDSKDSFPSAHTAQVFTAAMFIHKRYGWETAALPYALASFTAYTRLYGKYHDWLDVAGSVALSSLITSVFVREYDRGGTPRRGVKASVLPEGLDIFPWASPEGGSGVGFRFTF